MTYFTLQDHTALTSQDDATIQTVYDKFADLHTALYRRIRDHNYDLHPHWLSAAQISSQSAACLTESDCLALPYLRPREQAELVERLMGREGLRQETQVEAFRHPVIELRLTEHFFAIELIISPYAWWDQQNLVGKLAVKRHREEFRSIVQRMHEDFVIGYWDGIHLQDMHLTTQQLVRTNRLTDWIGTFSDGQDWLRIGAWYEPGDPALDTSCILNEIIQRFSALHTVYNFILWSSNNDFHPFYERVSKGGEARL